MRPVNVNPHHIIFSILSRFKASEIGLLRYPNLYY